MQRLKDPSHPPALFFGLHLGGKYHRVPRTGMAGSLKHLVGYVEELYRNNLDEIPEDLEDMIVQQVCQRFPKDCMGNPDTPRYSVPVVKSQKIKSKKVLQDLYSIIQGSKDWIAGVKAVSENLLGLTVDQATVEMRANICRTCPRAIPTSEVTELQRGGCTGCKAGRLKEAKKAASKAGKELCAHGGNHTIPPDLEELACGVCGCFMVCLLPVKGETLAIKSDTPEQAALRPDNCWAREFVQPPEII